MDLTKEMKLKEPKGLEIQKLRQVLKKRKEKGVENRKGKSVSAREEKEGPGGEIKRYQDNKKGHIEKERDTKM